MGELWVRFVNRITRDQPKMWRGSV